MTAHIVCADKTLSLLEPKVMGILNLTPDSFADGGRYNAVDSALQRVAAMVAEGADIVDIGAESSRPYAQRVSLTEEIDRLMTILLAVKREFDVIISVDTYKPEIMAEVINAGVHLINDIYALRHGQSLEIMARSNAAVCLMHMQSDPENMQQQPSYVDVVAEVGTFLQHRVDVCLEAGIAKDRIVIDPGFGFGKTTAHNMALLKNLADFSVIGVPILVGLSRKTSIGEILSVPVAERLYGSLAAQVIAYLNGARIIRTHDVKPTIQALKVAQAVIS